MTVILQDPVSPRDPSAGHAFPEPDSEAKASLDLRQTLAEELLVGYQAGPMAGELAEELLVGYRAGPMAGET
jgi:hypothetical protein